MSIDKKILKVAYIGNFSPPYSTENDVRKAFESQGHSVIQLQENEVTLDQVRREALNSDLLLHTGTWGEVFNLIDYIDMIHELAAKGIPSATLHLDTFWGTSRGGRKWWLEPMFHTAYLFTADGDYNDKWELFGANHMWLKPGVRHDAAHYGKERKEYECDVAFVGSNGVGYHEDVWSYRKELVDKIREICQRRGWSFKNPGGDDPKVDRNDDMNDFYASAKVTVGDSLCLKKEKAHYWSDRVPEATGRGGFLIMPFIEMVKVDFPMMPTYKFGDWDELEKVIEYYLHNDDERHTIQAQMHEIARADHTYVNRVNTMLRIMDLDK